MLALPIYILEELWRKGVVPNLLTKLYFQGSLVISASNIYTMKRPKITLVHTIKNNSKSINTFINTDLTYLGIIN